MTPNIHTIIRNHVSLSIECIDRLYINGYVPTLQSGGQLNIFFHRHRKQPIVSPALFHPMRHRFVSDIEQFAKHNSIPLVTFERGQRKDDIAAARRADFRAKEGVVFIGVAQERAMSFKAQKLVGPGGGVAFSFSRQSIFVNHYYFYVQDLEWGPAFLKVGTYLPFPVKLCLNGHEWVKQQLRKEGIAFDSLDNGFRSCAAPDRLQEICDLLATVDVQSFFDRWSHRLPWPLTPEDRRAGFDHRLSIWQLEVSLTQVFDRPLQGRHFFEQVIRDNLDLGRPNRVSMLFPHRMTRATPPPPHGYRTRVLTTGVNPSLHVEYKKSHVKQYFKEERALRTETTINEPNDFHVNKGVENLDHLRDLGRAINRRLLEIERVSHNCAISDEALNRLQRPAVIADQRAPALRFGDARVMALLHALCLFAHTLLGFRHRDIRDHVAGLLGEHYTASRMTYDLRRLRLRGLIHRVPKSNRYTVTTYGLQVALFYTKVHLRILRPTFAAFGDDTDPIPHPLRELYRFIDEEIRAICDEANLRPAA
jgi:hypothetical protein